MKWHLLLIIMLLFLPLVVGIDECKGIMHSGEIPCMVISTWQFPDSCNTYTINIYNSNASLIETKTMGNYGVSGRCNSTWNISTRDSYVLNWSSGDSSKIIIEGKDDMASLSITLFIGALTLALFYLGIKKDFSHSSLANLIIKRCMILGGMFLVSLDTAIMITIADNAGLGIDRELFRYLWGINWVIYFLMLWLAWTTVVNGIKLMENAAKEKRMGSNGENRYY